MIKDLQWISSLKDFERLRNKFKVSTVICLNMNTWSVAHKNANYKEIFEKSLVLCDGFWASKLARMLGMRVDLFAGPDFFMKEMLSENKYKHLVLGATQNKLEGVKEYLQKERGLGVGQSDSALYKSKNCLSSEPYLIPNSTKLSVNGLFGSWFPV